MTTEKPTQVEQVDIPPQALVHCPLVDFKLRPVQQCLDCEHFGGALVDRFPGGARAFVVRYRVPCTARATLREMQELAA